MRSVVFFAVMACSTPSTKPKDTPPTPPPTPTVVVDASASDEKVVRFEGSITNLNFGCWADGDCAIEVDKIWVWSPGGMRDNPPPQGKVIGFEIGGGGPAEEVKAKLLGKRVEVYAAKKPIWDETGNIRSYDAKNLTLEGDANYYVRAK